MELFNISFVILVLKITLCTLPGVFGIFLIVSSRGTKRKMRNVFCEQLFGVSRAIRTYKFARFLYIIAAFSILLSLVASWFLVLKGIFLM